MNSASARRDEVDLSGNNEPEDMREAPEGNEDQANKSTFEEGGIEKASEDNIQVAGTLQPIDCHLDDITKILNLAIQQISEAEESTPPNNSKELNESSNGPSHAWRLPGISEDEDEELAGNHDMPARIHNSSRIHDMSLLADMLASVHLNETEEEKKINREAIELRSNLIAALDHVNEIKKLLTEERSAERNYSEDHHKTWMKYKALLRGSKNDEVFTQFDNELRHSKAFYNVVKNYFADQEIHYKEWGKFFSWMIRVVFPEKVSTFYLPKAKAEGKKVFIDTCVYQLLLDVLVPDGNNPGKIIQIDKKLAKYFSNSKYRQTEE